MPNEFTLKNGNLTPAIRAKLYDRDENALDLTAATGVNFVMSKVNGSRLILHIDEPAQIVDAAAGVVQYVWQAGDTDEPGKYVAEWRVTWPVDLPETYPSNRRNEIEIFQKLG